MALYMLQLSVCLYWSPPGFPVFPRQYSLCFRTVLKMQASTVSPVTSSATTIYNTTITTKSTQQILIQSSGAMIAIIVIGIVIILAILLIILKTYNRRTHAARVLAGSSGKTTRKHTSSALPMTHVHESSARGSFVQSPASSENGPPRADLGDPREQLSANGGSALVTIHAPSVENT
ncbi:noncompact myelin-associated protein [Electrophorus electricus]|uniref:noncompact myelin-associated protein n=1 Tax=Electrophorus electricus TaxID=8005 RepID=UPI0015D0D05F|nr:noncompact myelin-associated protein [Electrophorus electricus]